MQDSRALRAHLLHIREGLEWVWACRVAVCAREAATEAEWRERVHGMGRGVTALRVPLGGELFSAKINFRKNEIGH